MPKPPIHRAEALRLDGAKVRLEANPDGTLKLTHERKVWKSVRIRIGRPLFKPDEFANVTEGEHHLTEVGLLVNLPGLNEAARARLTEHHHRYNLTTRITKVNSLSHQFGSAFWDVQTEKGHRQFVIRGTTEHVRWLSDDRILITDVHGNRFEILNMSALDRRSQDLIHLIL